MPDISHFQRWPIQYIGIRSFVPDISHFQRWSIYWYQELCARYLSLPALTYILVSGSLCQISLTSSVGLYIGIRIFVPDISHFQRWSIYWYQELCARYLSLPALVYILVSVHSLSLVLSSLSSLYSFSLQLLPLNFFFVCIKCMGNTFWASKLFSR